MLLVSFSANVALREFIRIVGIIARVVVSEVRYLRERHELVSPSFVRFVFFLLLRSLINCIIVALILRVGEGILKLKLNVFRYLCFIVAHEEVCHIR